MSAGGSEAMRVVGESRLTGTVVAIFIRAMDRPLIETLRRYDAALCDNGATGLFIFGSRARGTHHSDSDLDLFIDYNPAARVPNMSRLMQLEEEMSAALGIPVNITTRSAPPIDEGQHRARGGSARRPVRGG
jgi:predicted nucleotidyltransferase